MFRDGLDFKSSPFQFQVQYGIRQLVTLSNILQTLYINDYKRTCSWDYKEINIHWLVVSSPPKHISQWEGLSHVLWKINNL